MRVLDAGQGLKRPRKIPSVAEWRWSDRRASRRLRLQRLVGGREAAGQPVATAQKSINAAINRTKKRRHEAGVE